MPRKQNPDTGDQLVDESKERRDYQITEMKLKLRALYEDSNFVSMHRMYEALIDFEQSLYFSENSLAQTLNTESSQYATTFNIYVAMTMCRYFNKDISSLLSPPKAGEYTLPEVDAINAAGKYVTLEDPNYFGDFYGYMFSRNKQQSIVNPFTLNIEKVNGRVNATLVYRNRRKPITLHGVPKLITRTKNIYIIFSNADGEFFEFFFHYSLYRIDKMWYRRGIVVADESNTDCPSIENFVLFDKEIPKEKQKYLPGLLMISGSRFCISSSKVADMRADDPEIDSFFNEFEFLLEHDRDDMYIIDEDMIMSRIKHDSDESKHRAISQFLLVREQGEITRHLSYPSDSEYPGYAHDFLVK